MFATNLKAARESRKLSISALARKSHVHRVTLHHLEAGTRQPSMRTLDRIAAALDVDAGALLRAPPRRVRRPAKLRRTG
jgi:transcriptional regulator with XRE-family HTH domain